METNTNDKNLPAYKCRVGTIEAAVWEHKAEDRSFYNVTVTKSYKDNATNEWKQTGNFGTNDLPKLRLAIDECYRWIMLKSKE